MVVNYEFLDEEPIENVITCLHYKVDKVVFFGYHDVVEKYRERTAVFLKKYCDVMSVVFHEVSATDLKSVLKTMRAEIAQEKGRGSKVYFDITGGEDLILFAFGMLSKEFGAPVHMFDIGKDRLIEPDPETKTGISKDIVERKIKLDLDMFIEMRGGVINRTLHKRIKNDDDGDFSEDISNIWKVARKHFDYWNPFSDFLRTNMVPDENLEVSEKTAIVTIELRESRTKLRSLSKLNAIIDDLAACGILTGVSHTAGEYRFCFKNQKIKECLWEGGSILELHTYESEKKNSDDCEVGVHLDWDGVIHTESETDVLNEIDVLSITGNIPTFISCKSGKMGSNQTLYALYELDTVAARFGGKYAKKELVTVHKPSDIYYDRATEMGIKIR
ncbi:MAG: DUF1887 family protein [Lachnospiraceae bacterium]|nr:DUF1887 family protein [Lachnospiraceae bacterium]